MFKLASVALVVPSTLLWIYIDGSRSSLTMTGLANIAGTGFLRPVLTAYASSSSLYSAIDLHRASLSADLEHRRAFKRNNSAVTAFLPATTAGDPGTSYYVDQRLGNNRNNGTDPGTAWKTASKVNGFRFTGGDRILFKCGEQWRERLVMPSSGTAAARITVGAYGDCNATNKPLFLGSVQVSGWTKQSGVTYRTVLDWKPKMVFAGKTRFTPVASVAAITHGTFYAEGTTLYIQLPDGANPTGQQIEVSRYPDQNFGLIDSTDKNFITYDNLEVRYSNWFAFRVYGGDGITIKHSRISHSYSNGIVAIGTPQGALSDPNGFIAQHNELRHGGYSRSEAGLGGLGVGAEAIAIDSSNGFQINSNTVDDWRGEALVAAFAAQDGTITHNRITNQQMSGAIYLCASRGRTLQRVHVAYNLVDTGTNVKSITALLFSIEGSGAIRNSTAHHNVLRNWPHGYALVMAQDGGAATITNCSFFDNSVEGFRFGILYATNATYRGNSFRKNSISIAGSGRGVTWTGDGAGIFDENHYSIPAAALSGFRFGSKTGDFAWFRRVSGQERNGILLR